MFRKDEFENFLLDLEAARFLDKPVTLRSGRPSYYYVNCRSLTDTIRRKDRLMEFMMAFITDRDIDPDYFLGVPEGATKMALALNDHRAKVRGDERYLDAPWVQMRSKPKEGHGSPRDRYFLGAVKEGDKVAVLEDVLTTGDSLLDRLVQLQEAGLKVECAIGLVNRRERRGDGSSVEEALESRGVRLECLTDSRSLLLRARDRFRPGDDILKKVQQEVAQYGAEPWTFDDTEHKK